MPYCPDCGAGTDADDVYCHNCGATIRGRSREEDGYHSRRDEPSQPPEYGGGSSRESADEYDRGRSRGYDTPGVQRDTRRGPGGDNGRRGPGRDDGRRGQQARDRRGPDEYGPRRDHSRSNQRPQRIEDGKTGFALKFPISNGYGPLGGGALCSFLSFLLLPMFTLYGYVYRITGAATRGESVQPTFSDDLVGMSIKGLVLSLLYLAVFAAVAVLAIVAGAGGMLVSDAVAAVLAAVVVVVGLYISPAILTLYPATESATSALSPRRIADFAFTGKYFASYLLFILLLIGVHILFFILLFGLAITVIGLLLWFPLIYLYSAYIPYLTGAYWGATYYEAVDRGLVVAPGVDSHGGYEAEPPRY